MIKDKEQSEPNKGGRPTKYKPEYAEQTRKLCLLGYTNDELANFYQVNVDTLYEWRNTYPEFSEAILNGRDYADSNVAAKLYHRATGYEHKETEVRVIDGKIVEVTTIKHYPPDTAAAIIWLKNRNPKKWRDKQDTDAPPVIISVNVTKDEVKAISEQLDNDY